MFNNMVKQSKSKYNASTQKRLNASNCAILYMEEKTCDSLVYAWFVQNVIAFVRFVKVLIHYSS